MDLLWLLLPVVCADLALQKLSEPSARCLDGSQAGFYFRQATNSSFATNWVILLQGGGLCVTESDCKARALSTLGSSINWTSTINIQNDLLDDRVQVNPHFYEWNQVFIPYCGGDFHSGQWLVPNQWGLYFSGKIVVDTVMDTLIAEHNLQAGTTVVVTGESAGGIGAFYHYEHFAAKLPSSKVYGAPIGGYFFGNDWPYTGPGSVPSPYYFRTQDFQAYAQLWNSTLHPACMKAKGNNAFECLITQELFPFLTVPVFVNHALTDNVYIILFDNIPNQPPNKFTKPESAYVNEWGANMTRAMQQIRDSPSSGLYAPACYMHCGGQERPLVQGPTSSTPTSNFPNALYGWLCNHGAVVCPTPGKNPNIYIDTCQPIFPNCNPTC